MVPLVSILIPCYNAERWLFECLTSALNQSWPRKEVIIINDGSTDGSLQIARGFESSRVRVINQTNQGASAARNAGLKEAVGDYIQYLDADDLLAPDKIEQQLASIGSGEEDVLLSGAWGRFLEDIGKAVFRPDALWADLDPLEFLFAKYSLHSMMHPAAWLVSKALADASGPWDERLSLDDDGEYFGRVVLSARRIRYCGGARSFYRSRLKGSLSRARSERAWTSQFDSVRMTLEKVLNRENSPRMRRLAADTLQRTVFEAYPSCPEIRRSTARRIMELGGSSLQYEAGPRFGLAARLLGWRLAKRLRNLTQRFV